MLGAHRAFSTFDFRTHWGISSKTLDRLFRFHEL